MSVFTAAVPPEQDVLRRVVDHVRLDLTANLETAALAAVAGVSPRHLTRLYQEHIGCSPRSVRPVRAHVCRSAPAGDDVSTDCRCRRCGLGTSENLRQAFVGGYGVPPSAYRAAAVRGTDEWLITDEGVAQVGASLAG